MSKRNLSVLVDDCSRVLRGVSIVSLQSAYATAVHLDRSVRLTLHSNRHAGRAWQQSTAAPPPPPPPPPFSSSSTFYENLSSASASAASAADALGRVGRGLEQLNDVARTAGPHVIPIVNAAFATLRSSKSRRSSTRSFSTIPPQRPPPSSPPPPPPTSRSTFHPNERDVPASPMARLMGFGAIALSLVGGSVVDATKRAFAPPSTADATTSSFMTEANTERLAAGLCRMRGAALKIGQMLSIQDDSLLPAPLQRVLQRVRDSADIMPKPQLERTLANELGAQWPKRLRSFEWTPIAAASIGQVHRAELLDGRHVVMKIQYPGVAQSIHSDVDNVRRLVRYFNVLPRGMYIDETMAQAKIELTAECDYHLEARAQTEFKDIIDRSNATMSSTDESMTAGIKWNVPRVITDLSTARILTSEHVEGVPIDNLAIGGNREQSQSIRNAISQSLMRLCLSEVFVWRLMQTDPNWSNFIYDESTRTIHLLDFGATKHFDAAFVDSYFQMVSACIAGDRDRIIRASMDMRFLTGDESKAMNDAHCAAAMAVAEPFTVDKYDFATGNISSRVSEQAAIMLRLRLTPPPKESYTLHRKLSGAYLTCKKLNAQIRAKYEFDRIRQLRRTSASSVPIDGNDNSENTFVRKQLQQHA